MRRFAGLLALAIVAAPAAAETDTEADLGVIAEEVVGYFVLPRYQALAEATAQQAEAWREFCAAPSVAGRAVLTARFAAATDAWAAVEVIRFGPIGEAGRYERMNHYPERRNAIGRGLGPLLAGSDPADLASERFRRTSVAVQGLAALERVLFDEAPQGSGIEAGAAAGRRRCAVGAAMAGALAETAAEVAAAWQAGDDTTRLEPRDLVARALTDLLTLYRLVLDTKLSATMGVGPEDVRPKAAEYWRSGRSDRVVAVDLAAAQALTAILAGPNESARAATAPAATATAVAEAMPARFADLAADPARRHTAVLLQSAIRAARNGVARTMPAALGVNIGFNALDGD